MENVLTRPRGCFAQAGAVAALNNMDETAALVTHYMGNAKMIRETMEGIGFECHGGQDAPYVFVRFPGRDSWDVFKEIMEKVQVRHRSFFWTEKRRQNSCFAFF